MTLPNAPGTIRIPSCRREAAASCQKVRSRAVLLFTLCLTCAGSSLVRAEVLALIAFDENITASPEQVADYVAVSRAEVLFQGELLRPGTSPVNGLLLHATEEQFVFLASAPGMFPFPFSYLPYTNLGLEHLGYGCPFMEPGLDVKTCLTSAWTTAATGVDAAAVVQAVQEAGGTAESTGYAFVPAGKLQVLATDPRVGTLQLIAPFGGGPGEYNDDLYFQWLYLGRNHRFEVLLSVESERVPDTGSLSRSGKRTYLSRDGGAFWIFEPENTEVFIKVLDGCSLNGHYWLFLSGLTDLGTNLQIWDYGSRQVRTISTEEGAPYPSLFDNQAFPCS
jgi:hypothetical protein